MKQKIYWIGLIALILTILGIVFKTLHYPGASVLLTLGFMTLVLGFLPIALLNSYRNEPKRLGGAFYIVTYITIFIVFTGMLFKIMHWPGASKLLLVGIVIPYVLFLPVFLISTGKVENYSIFNTVSVLLLLAFTSVFNVLLALGVSKDRLDDSMYLASVYQRSAVLGSRESVKAGDGGTAIIESSEKVLKLIRESKEGMLVLSGGNSELLGSDPMAIEQPDSRTIPNAVLFSGKEPFLGERLEESIKDLINIVDEIGDPYLTSVKAKELLYFATFENDNRNWNEIMFAENWNSWSLVYLGMLENNVLLIRNELLSGQI